MFRIAATLSLLACVASWPVAAGESTGEGYCGLSLRDLPEGRGTIVSWIQPGPLAGTGIASPTLCRPDLIVAVDGRSVTAREFEALVRARAPGETLRIEYRVATVRGGAIPAAPAHEEQVRTIEVVLADREAWTGSIGRPRGHDTALPLPAARLLDPTDQATALGAALEELALGAPLAATRRVLADRPEEETDFHHLAAVRAAFADPLRLPEIAAAVTSPARAIPSRPRSAAVELGARALDLPLPAAPGQGGSTIGEPMHGVFVLDFLLNEPRLMLAEALGPLAGDEAFARRCVEFLRIPRRTFSIQGESAAEAIGVIRASLRVDFARLLAALNHLDLEVSVDPAFLAAVPDLPPEPLPEPLARAVEGTVLAAEFVEGAGWLVVGGTGPNRYDMAVVAGVVDLGGDDRYEATGLRLGNRAIVDLAGNDRYGGTPEQGPGSALLGVSLIDDRGGNDLYEGELLACGAAMFGAALVLDRGGDDVYRGSEWSLGAGVYGIGLLVDLGGGGDRYEGQFLCQGVGGPRGLGAIVDDGGRDWYRAHDPEGSAYGTAAVSRAFSQGLGFGYRQFAAGGIGLLCDLGGDDRYDAGEFAQGGAYYHGLGVLWDAAGRDLYFGNRYGQGFGVHQAFGVLLDDEGDDTYWSMTAASQGAGWDIAAGLLLDRAGNDSYQADGLAQGGAAQQAIALLVDLGGDDRYSAAGGAVQGQSGGNEYHGARTGAGSFSLLLDLGGGRDWYSSGRPNDAATATAPPRTESLAGHVGMAVDG